MADPGRPPSTPDDGRVRRRRGGSRLLRWSGLVLVLTLVIGAVVVRLGDGPRSSPSFGGAVDTGPTDTGPTDTVADAVSDPGTDSDVGAPDGPAVPGTDTTGGWHLAEPPPAGDDSAVAGNPPSPAADTPAGDSIRVPPVPAEGWADPSEPSPVAAAPVPDSLRVPEPAAVRGIYVGSWSVGARRRLATLLALADATEINTFVIDVKDVTGEVSHATEVPLAVQLEAARDRRIGDLRAVLDTLRAHGIYPIARIVVFKDPLLATARPEWSVRREDGSPWVDDRGVRWVDAFNRRVWDYNIELAREAMALGFGEIQWDYVRFPDVPAGYDVEPVYPARDGRTMADAIREFLTRARERLPDGTLTADVFGITTTSRRDVGIGQVWESMADRVNVLLPMVYPSHYPPGMWGFPNPNAAPYQVVRRALDDAVERSLMVDGAADIRPWLQAFSLGEPEYGPRHIRAQIDAVYDAGLSGWLLWDPAVDYPRTAFTTAAGVEPWFAGMGAMLYDPGEWEAGEVTEPPDSAASTDRPSPDSAPSTRPSPDSAPSTRPSPDSAPSTRPSPDSAAGRGAGPSGL
ncbi:MAG: putative glycoside hydrolase [Gemmatimonadota bacterium]